MSWRFLSTTVTSFPVLVRLGAADSAIFAQSVGRGADLRFSKANNTTRVAYQIERWDSAAKAAAIWVLVDTVRGNVNNQSLRMHWNKSGAADSSNGRAVFDTSKGFQAVWHMNGATATTNEPDATVNNFTATQNNSPATAAGAIAGARILNGTNNYFSTTGTASGPLNFVQGGNFTISAWVNASNATGNATFVSKNDRDYALKLQAGGGWEIFEFEDVTGWNAVINQTPATVGSWEYVVGAWSGAGGAVYINGALATNTPTLTTSTNTRVVNTNVTIGRQNESTNRYFGGTVDEIRMANVARDSSWVWLEYQNQKAAQVLVSLSDTIPAFAVSPTISSHPASRSIAQGASVKFGAAATGSGVLTFKWVKNNTDTVRTTSSVTSDSLALTNVQIADNNATYKVVVSNSIGSIVSSSATLTVNVTAAISAQPTAQSGSQGGTVKFSVSATGTNLTFKWVKNNTDTVRTITGTNADTLTLTNLPVSDNNASYKVVISNPLNQVVSNSVTLTVVGILPGTGRNTMAILASGSSLQFRFPDGMPALRLSVMDVWGRTVWSHTTAAGTREMAWNGNATAHRSASSGIYIARVAPAAKPAAPLLERKILLAR